MSATREELRAERLATNWEVIEAGIGPNLRFEPVSDNQSDQDREIDKVRKYIITPDGERVGSVRVERSGYSWQHKDDRYRLTCDRIPMNRSSWRGAYRDYKKVESVIAAILKFCHPVTLDEVRASELRDQLRHIRNVVDASAKRSYNVNGEQYYRSVSADEIVRRLASDDDEEKLLGMEMLHVLIRKRRVHNRFRAWVDEHMVKPRTDELNSLDTSKEKIS